MKFTMMVGLSASGKSTEAQKIAEEENAVLMSSDKVREWLWGDESCQNSPETVFSVLNFTTRELLKTGRNIVYDATNLNSKRRIALLKDLKKIKELETECVIMATPHLICIERDTARNRTVGTDVIMKQLKQFQCPQVEEGWNEIRIVNGGAYSREILSKDLPHDSPWHRETILEHIGYVMMEITNEPFEATLLNAAIYHDIGKLFTKTFDEDGIAHYFSHDNVSTYIFLCDESDRPSQEFFIADTLYTAKLIQNHMKLHQPKHEKWKAKQDSRFMEDLVRLHAADTKGAINELNPLY